MLGSAERGDCQCFNPHRLLGVGATHGPAEYHIGLCRVSILTDSWESVQRRAGERIAYGFLEVSILTDSWESVQQSVAVAIELQFAFQSSPTPGSRCNNVSVDQIAAQPRFNPHRLLGVGATYRFSVCLPLYPLFQSSPTPGSRCNRGEAVYNLANVQFQSSPTPGSRCNAEA